MKMTKNEKKNAQKALYIDAIRGSGVSYTIAQKYMGLDMMRQTGNQYNPNFRWKYTVLRKLSVEKLMAIYEEVRHVPE